jgi:hypothetical protein
MPLHSIALNLTPTCFLFPYRASYIHKWAPIPVDEIITSHARGLYNSPNHCIRHLINLDNHPLFDDNELEVPIYDSASQHILRHKALFDPDKPNCGILMDLFNIQALFTSQTHYDNLDNSSNLSNDTNYTIHINVYPLAFLKSYSNLQATGIPYCFHKCIPKINHSICRLSYQSPQPNDEDDNNLFSIGHQ